MKNKNKFKIAIALFILVFTALTFSVGAENDVVENPDYGGAIIISDGLEIEVEDTTPMGGETITPSDNESEEEAEGSATEKQIFDEIYQEILKNADKIFAALAFIGTMLVSFAYKKGLLPLLKGAISTLAGSVEKIRESGTELMKHTDDRFGSLCDNMRQLATENASVERSISSIDERLAALDTVTEQYGSMKVILASQIDMLYAIFMSSALPQYQKEEVGEKIKQMKKELAKYEESEE